MNASIDLVGCYHDEKLEELEDRIPRDSEEYDVIYHEDFPQKTEHISTIDVMQGIFQNPAMSAYWFALRPIRCIRRCFNSGSVKTDYKYVKKHPIPTIPIDISPKRLISDFEMPFKLSFIQWTTLLFILVFTLFSVYRAYLDNLATHIRIIMLILFGVGLLALFYIANLQKNLSYQLRDKIMAQKIAGNYDSNKKALCIVGDDHVPGMYYYLSSKHGLSVNPIRKNKYSL